MGIFAILIINKAGGLIYNKDFGTGINKLTSNEYLVLAGTFHGIHAISSQISPVSNSSGIESLVSKNLKIHCFQSQTGLKFVIFTDPAFTNLEATCKRFYEIYADYAMKNPFYTPEMPIRAELFSIEIERFAKVVNS